MTTEPHCDTPTLDELVEAVDRCPEHHDDPWAVWAIPQEGGGWSVALQADLTELIGGVAPADIEAVAVKAGGRTRHLGRTPRVNPVPERIELVVAIDRSGRVAGRLHPDTGLGVPDQGRIPDLMRRMLGLPTLAPDADARQVMVTAWLIDLVAMTAGAPARSITWSEVLAHHPANSGRARLGVADMEADRVLVDAGVSWGLLRSLTAAGGGGLVEICPPEVAAWMDEGVFSRWVLGALGDAEVLLKKAVVRLTPAATSHLLDAIAAGGPWGADLVRAVRPRRR